MSSYNDYDDEFDPYLGHEYERMDSPQSDWSELETPAGDEVDEEIDIASEDDTVVPVVELAAKSREGSP
jgi:hypothetical protein